VRSPIDVNGGQGFDMGYEYSKFRCKIKLKYPDHLRVMMWNKRARDAAKIIIKG
jgi:hypothetical protein